MQVGLQQGGGDTLAGDVAEQNVERGVFAPVTEQIHVISRDRALGLPEPCDLPARVRDIGGRQESPLDPLRAGEILLQRSPLGR